MASRRQGQAQQRTARRLRRLSPRLAVFHDLAHLPAPAPTPTTSSSARDARATVTPMPCMHGAQLPRGELMAQGVPVPAAGRVATTLRALPPLLDKVQVALVTEQARRQLHPTA
jgi:hypothetical protein